MNKNKGKILNQREPKVDQEYFQLRSLMNGMNFFTKKFLTELKAEEK